MPQIPLLANGAYVKANQPQLAIIGDNKRHGEIVAPEDKLEDIYKKVLADTNSSINQEIISLLKTIIQLIQDLGLDFNLYIDAYELETRLERARKKNNFAKNGG